jgi:hypothetical protein
MVFDLEYRFLFDNWVPVISAWYLNIVWTLNRPWELQELNTGPKEKVFVSGRCGHSSCHQCISDRWSLPDRKTEFGIADEH